MMQSVVFDNSLGKLDVSQRLKLTSINSGGPEKTETVKNCDTSGVNVLDKRPQLGYN